jgi:uncharacterized membrane protein YgcG
VDSLYFKRFGRRKSWVVPVQCAVGVVLICLSGALEVLLDNDPPRIAVLTAGFFLLYFLVATQDIAVDGWALTMLRRENVGYASACNSVGINAGYSASYVAFLAGTSPEFANYFRAEPSAEGLFTMAQFLSFWGVVFLAATALLLAVQPNDPEPEPPCADIDTPTMLATSSADPDATCFASISGGGGGGSSGGGGGGGGGSAGSSGSGRGGAVAMRASPVGPPPSSWATVCAAYREMLCIARLRNVAVVAAVVLTARIGFLSESAIQFELMERGVKKEQIVLLGLPMLGLEVRVCVFVCARVRENMRACFVPDRSGAHVCVPLLVCDS